MTSIYIYDFPKQLDLDYGHRWFLAEEADESVSNLYKLHSVTGRRLLIPIWIWVTSPHATCTVMLHPTVIGQGLTC